MTSGSIVKEHFTRLTVLTIVVVAGSFLTAAIVIQRASRQIDSLSDSIVHNSSPSIERLASLRGSTLEVELALSRYLATGNSTAHPDTALTRSLSAVEGAVQDYLRLPVFPGEQRHWNEVQQAWARFDESSKRAQVLVDAGNARDARLWLTSTVEPNAVRLLDAAMRAIEFNAERGRVLASSIKQTRLRTTILTYGLAVSCVVLGIAGALLVHLRGRARRASDRANSELLEARSAELEQFAGRVAHDIRGPLSTARMAGDLCMARSADEAAVRELVTRIIRSLSRADAITTGLLEFARAGARPDPGARTDVREALADLVNALAAEAEHARIIADFEAAPPVLVACSVGVYLSLVGNIARNAIKYMNDATVRRVVVRVTEQDSMVRTEVIDTGPGIRDADQASLFDLYFRGRHQRAQGFGLGLATVKRLVDGHHGKLGVTSALGKGSTFWFELPKAGVLQAANDRDALSEPTRAATV
jgi:signal transduction histidine kinase